MRDFFIVVYYLFAGVLPVSSQTILWEKEYNINTGTAAFDIDLMNGAAVFVGRTGPSHQGYVSASNSNGDILWSKVFTFQDATESVRIIENNNGGYLILSNYQYYTPSLFNIDASGDTSWTKRFSNNPRTVARGLIRSKTDYMIAGTELNEDAFWLANVDSIGSILWERYYKKWRRSAGYSVLTVDANNYFCLGHTSNDTSTALWLFKVDSLGEIIIEKTFQFSKRHYPQEFIKTKDGNYIILATEINAPGTDNLLMLKVDTAGDTLWVKRYSSSSRDVPLSIRELSDESLIIVGYKKRPGEGSTNNIWMLKTDSMGNVMWEYIHATATSDMGNDIIAFDDDEYIVLGNRWSGSAHVVILLKVVEGLVSIGENDDNDQGYMFYTNYPNPFNSASTIQFDLPKSTMVSLMIYDILGREVANLIDGDMQAGYHGILWSGTITTGQPVPSGIYIARLTTPEYSKSIKMVLLK